MLAARFASLPARQLLLGSANVAPHSLRLTSSHAEADLRKFFEQNAKTKRPISPHLQIYKWEITMTMSILHRISGCALAVGIPGVAAVMALSGIPADCVIGALASGQVQLIAAKAALAGTFFFHTFNGVRHLNWDQGNSLTNAAVTQTGLTVVAATIIATFIALMMSGTTEFSSTRHHESNDKKKAVSS